MTTNERQAEEEDEQVQQVGGGSTRRAFFAGVHQGDTFSGSFRGVPTPKHGGAASVRPEDILGDEEHCWCGELLGHSWPGKNTGAKHPRGENMSAATDEKPYLNPRDLKAWDRQVVRALCEIVNAYGVTYRIDKNQMHIYLFAPGGGDETVTKFKAARSRAPEQTLKFLEKWATTYVRPAKVAEATSALKAKFNDPAKRPHEKASEQPPEPAPQPTAPEPTAPTPTPEPGGSEPLAFVSDDETDSLDALMEDPPEGYHQHYRQKDGAATNWWEKDGGGHYKCKSCDYEVEAKNLSNRSAHQGVHTLGPEGVLRRSKNAAAAVDHETKGRRARARSAIKLLAEEFGVELGGGDREVGKLQKRIEKLEQEVDSLTRERDDARAKFDLARELFQQ